MRYLILFLSLFVQTLHAADLSCANIANKITQCGDSRAHAVCDTAEIMCHTKKFYDALSDGSELKQALEGKFETEFDFHMNLCRLVLEAYARH